MKPKDIAAMDKIIKKNNLYTVKINGKGLLFCPSSEEIQFVIRSMDNFSFDVLEQKDWDLMNPYAGEEKYEIGIMCNMFMYSSSPSTWFNNLSTAIDLLVVQDVIRCPRMDEGEFGSDGDCSRFSFFSRCEFPRVDPHFDMEKELGDAIIDVDFYSDDGNGERDCRKFAAIIDMRKIR